MIDYYTYWAERRADRWEARCDWLLGWPRKASVATAFLGFFWHPLFVNTLIWLAAVGIALWRYGKAVDDYGKAVDNMRVK